MLAVLADFASFTHTTRIHRVSVMLFLVLSGVGMGIGFSIASSNAQSAADVDFDRRLAVFSHFEMELVGHLTKSSSLAATIGAFALSSVSTPTNLSAPAAERMATVNQPAFDTLGSHVYISDVTSMVLAPGGVITQVYPAGSSVVGTDMLTIPMYRELLPKFTNMSGIHSTGPKTLPGGSGYGIFVWFPIHVSNVTALETFWGVAYILIEIPTLLEALGAAKLTTEHSMDYALWYTTVEEGAVPTVIAESDPAATAAILEHGMRMDLPVSDDGRTSHLAMYPRGGPVLATVRPGTAAAVAVATLAGSAAVVFLVYLSAFAHFLYRHRRAPANNTAMYIAALSLRGAQPIADRAPLVAVRMFNEFTTSVRRLALQHGCYPVCEIGDRCVYVVAKDPKSVLGLAQAAVQSVVVQRHEQFLSRNSSVLQTVNGATATAGITSHLTENMTESSFIGPASCHASAACHTITAVGVYDAEKDLYFFGSGSQLLRLCGALDVASSGEVCWTDSFESRCLQLCREAATDALASHSVTENGDVLHVASWWKESGDERDNEDPSAAMAVLSDAYVRRMTVIVSRGRSEVKQQRKRHDGAETKSGGSSNRSNEATALTRTATLLHVAVLSGDEKVALEVVRRIVGEEKGVVVSAHEATIVAAFNLLSAGGHHQARAADTVMRLREALPSTHFACSIQHGKVGALIMDGLVMCTGEAVSRGRALLHAAVAMSTAGSGRRPDMATYLTPESEGSAAAESTPKRRSELALDNGLCLLSCHEDLTSTYECEAVDVAAFGASKPRVVYRLACRRSGKSGNDDEWMYQLKGEEDGSPYAAVNAVFERIAAHELEEAGRMWREYSQSVASVLEISNYARASIARLLR